MPSKEKPAVMRFSALERMKTRSNTLAGDVVSGWLRPSLRADQI